MYIRINPFCIKWCIIIFIEIYLSLSSNHYKHHHICRIMFCFVLMIYAYNVLIKLIYECQNFNLKVDRSTMRIYYIKFNIFDVDYNNTNV